MSTPLFDLTDQPLMWDPNKDTTTEMGSDFQPAYAGNVPIKLTMLLPHRKNEQYAPKTYWIGGGEKGEKRLYSKKCDLLHYLVTFSWARRDYFEMSQMVKQ